MRAHEDGVRAVADAMHRYECDDEPCPWDDLDDVDRDFYERQGGIALVASLRWAVAKVLAGPEVPLPPSVYAALLTEYADDIEGGGTDD